MKYLDVLDDVDRLVMRELVNTELTTINWVNINEFTVCEQNPTKFFYQTLAEDLWKLKRCEKRRRKG